MRRGRVVVTGAAGLVGQDPGVGPVLVERHDVGVAARLQPGDEVLADEAGRARDDDAAMRGGWFGQGAALKAWSCRRGAGGRSAPPS